MSLWFKNLPAGWEEAPLKSRLARNDGGVWGEDPDGSDTDTVVLRSTEQRVDGSWNIEAPALRKLTKSEAEAGRLQVGDLVVTKSSGSDLHIGKTSLVTPEVAQLSACYSNFMQRLRVDERTEPRFIHYWMNNELCREQFAYLSNSTSGLANLNATMLGSARLAFPSQSEQERIANFLDEQTARIDSLIAEKEALRTAVREFFTSRLGTAVVHGISRDRKYVPAVDKGFETVPKDWGLVPLKHLATSTGGMTPSKDNDLFWSGEIPWVSPKDMKRFVLHDSADHVSQAALDNSSLKLNPVDSVLVVVRGMILAHTFPVAMNAVPVTINQDMKALRPNSRISAKYLAWLLRGLQPLMLSLTEESAHGTKALRTDQWANQCVPVPPPSEQEEMVAAFEAWESGSTTLVSHLTEHIDRLREYRSSLISAAVTGQLDLGSAGNPKTLAAIADAKFGLTHRTNLKKL